MSLSLSLSLSLFSLSLSLSLLSQRTKQDRKLFCPAIDLVEEILPRGINFAVDSSFFLAELLLLSPSHKACEKQPRDTCYVANEGLSELRYSGYQPHAYSWDDYPPLKDILAVVHESLPGTSFNSLLLNRYNSGSDYVAWHADDEKVYGPTPEIASVSFGCEREFLLRKRPTKSAKVQVKPTRSAKQPPNKRLKNNSHDDQHSFMLKHGSLLVMKGYTQRDWVHSVPKRARAEAVRINLTFRRVL